MARGTRLSGTLPVSVAVHVLVFGVVLVAPLLADISLPPPATSLPAYVRALPVPPPPAARPPAGRARPQPRALTSRVAPFEAPSAIVPERAEPAPDVPGIAGGIGSDALPSGVGVVVREPVRAADPPPLPSPVPAAVRVADLPQPPRKLVDVRPIYPEGARAARMQGTVVLEAVIDRSGRVDQLKVRRSVPLLDEAALDAVRQWRYAPSTLRGQPVSVLMTITINFTLQ